MAKTKKNVQKKRRRIQKKTRGFGKGRGANTSKTGSISYTSHRRTAYVPTKYIVNLGDDNSNFEHMFDNDPGGPTSDVHPELIAAINEYRELPERNDYPTKVLDAWHYELRTKPDETKYIFVPQSTIQKNNLKTGEITFTFVKSPYKPRK
jgi:hypothetical protein